MLSLVMDNKTLQSSYTFSMSSNTVPSVARRNNNGSNSSVAYCSRDVASEPPTPVLIVRSPSDLDPNDPSSRYYVLEQDIEPTDGWQSRHSKPQLSICFMHSFGKCVGRFHNDPSTCHQLHVKQEVVEALRRTYHNPARRYFSRTIKAHLTPELLEVISQVARKELTLLYLEYLAQDVQETEGLNKYERSYRAWLSAPGGFTHAFHDISVPQCADYALRGACKLERSCSGVHAHLRRAQVRDNIVVNALRAISAPFDGPSGRVSPSEHLSDGSSMRGSPTLSPRFQHSGMQSALQSRTSPPLVLSGTTSPTHHHMSTGQQQHHQQQQQQFVMQQHPGLPSFPYLQGPPPSFYQQQQQQAAYPQQQVLYQQSTSPALEAAYFAAQQANQAAFQQHAARLSPPQQQPVFVMMMPQQQQQQQQQQTHHQHHMQQMTMSSHSPPTVLQQQPQILYASQDAFGNATTMVATAPQEGGDIALDFSTLSGQLTPTQGVFAFDANQCVQRSGSPAVLIPQRAISPPTSAGGPTGSNMPALAFQFAQMQVPPQANGGNGVGASAAPAWATSGAAYIPSVYRCVDNGGLYVLEGGNTQSN